MPIGPKNDELKIMRKIKLTDILLLSVSGLLDIFQELKDPGKLYSNYYENFYGFVPSRWKRQNYYALVSRLIEDKKIEKLVKKNQINYKITSKGLIHLQKKQLLLNYQKKKWDKKWRILIFDIEESNRNTRSNLRDTIKEFGFGYLQKSVWISPYDVFQKIQGFINTYNLKNQIVLIESKKLSIPNQKLASLVWQIDFYNFKYNQIYKKLCAIYNQQKGSNLKILKKEFNKLYKELLNIVLKDPHLPKEFLTKNWPYQKTVNLAKKLRHYFIKIN